MRALLLVVALACACKREKATVTADPADKTLPRAAPIVIKKVAPRVGIRAHETRTISTEMKLGLSVGGAPPGASGFTRTEHDERTEEVLAVEGRAVTKVRVTYDLREEESSLPAVGGPTPKKASPVTGRTYEVEAVKTGIEVRDAHGKLPSADELLIVRRDYESLGKEDEVTASLPDTPLHVGDPVPSMAHAVESKLVGKHELRAEGDVDVHVKSLSTDVVVFALKATFVTAGSALPMRMPIEGTVTVRVADGWLTGFEMEAPLTIGSPDAGSLNGTGTLSMSSKRTYL